MVAWTNVAVWGADVSPNDLLPLPWETPHNPDPHDPEPWSYEETMKRGVGLLDYLNELPK